MKTIPSCPYTLITRIKMIDYDVGDWRIPGIRNKRLVVNGDDMAVTTSNPAHRTKKETLSYFPLHVHRSLYMFSSNSTTISSVSCLLNYINQWRCTKQCHNHDCPQEAPSDFLSPVSGVWSAFKIHKSLPLLILELVEKSQNVEIPNSSVFWSLVEQ